MILYKLKKRIKHVIKDLIYYSGIQRNKKILIYLGTNEGEGLKKVFRKYKKCYAFDANPEAFDLVSKKFKKYKNVVIINAAVAKEKGQIEFNIANNSVSSSLGNFDENWTNKDIKIIRKVTVPTINLYDFLKERNIDYIDDYISDIQGFDLEVLKSMEDFIKRKRIGTITSEVAKDEYRNIYKDLPNNNLSDFNKLLEDNYELVATGEGVLQEGVFNEVPESWWEMDCMWKAKL